MFCADAASGAGGKRPMFCKEPKESRLARHSLSWRAEYGDDRAAYGESGGVEFFFRNNRIA